jgi:hypothetical protein
MDRPALIVRFPQPFWWRPDPRSAWPADWPVVPSGAEAHYPQLAPDLRVWQKELEEPFRLLDHQAQLLQQRFWRQRTTLIVGGLLATTLGAFQASQGDGNLHLAVVQALVTGFLTGVAAFMTGMKAQAGYLDARLRAERIKSEFFLYLARAGDYAGADRLPRLRHTVEDIADAEVVS